MMRLYHGTALIAWELVQRRGLLPYNEIGRRVHAALDQPLILQPFVHLTTDPLIAPLYAGGLPIPDMDADVEDYVEDLLATGEGVRATREGLILAVDVEDDEIAEWEFEPGKFYEDEAGGRARRGRSRRRKAAPATEPRGASADGEARWQAATRLAHPAAVAVLGAASPSSRLRR